MDPVIGAGLIEAGADLLSGLFSGFSQDSANQTNIQLARENRDWQEKMWEKTNEYNTPAAQIERMKAAGLNPALMYSQGQVGNASTPSAPAAPHVQPVTGLAQGLGVAGSSIANSLIQLEQVKQMRAQTELLQNKAVKEKNSTLTAAQYLEELQAKVGLQKKQASYYDSKAAGQDIYNIFEPSLLANQKRAGELSNTKLNMDMWISIAKLQLDYQNYELRKRMTDSQVNYYYHLCRLAQQKYNVVDQMTPVQLQELGHQITKMAAETKNVEQRTDYMDEELILKAISVAAKYMPTPVLMP